jgi:hypothetical protein
MRIRHTVTAFAIATAVALSVGACGNWTPPLPSGPSALPSPLDSVPAEGATIIGTLTGGAAGISPMLAASTSNETVTVEGTNITASVSVTGTFVLEGVPAGNITLKFSGSQTGSVRVDHVDIQERIDLKVRISGASASIDAIMRIKVDNTTEMEGNVTATTGTCPNITIQVSGWSASVTSESDSQCADIHVGMRVRIRGHISNRIVIAVKVEISGTTTTPPPSTPNHDGDDDDD